jgi:V/A-type H+-transporting ATPase subunit D
VEQVTATRSELLVRRAQIALALQGRDVLKEKRDQLMEEFRKVADIVLSGSEALDHATAAARRRLARAEAIDGPEAVRSAGLATRATIPLTASVTSVMGVRIADIQYGAVGMARTARGYSLEGTSAAIDDAAADFETVLSMILELAADELRLRRLVDEIGKTTRRVNALESVVIPRLEREKLTIQAVLEERERQDRFRLKRFSARRGERLAQGTP